MELSPADIGEEDLREWCSLANWAAFEICGYRNTCIVTSHALAAFLQARGLDAEPFRAEATVHSPDRNVTGFSVGTRGDGSRRPPAGPGMWHGHLAVECGQYVLDPTIDQSEVGGVRIHPAVYVKPDGWLDGRSAFWDESGLTVRHARFWRQIGWISASASRPRRWRPILSLMEAAITWGPGTGQLSFGDVQPPVPPPPGAPEPETWREIPSCPDYLASSLGRVYSKPRKTSGGGTMSLQQRQVPGGSYWVQSVRLVTADGSSRTANVHQLIAEAFIGVRPPGQVVRHGPNGSLDNRASQLCYGSPKDNNGTDKRRDGTILTGDAHQNSKLTMEIVGECRVRYAAGRETFTGLALEFGVEDEGMRKAVLGLTWTTCPVPPAEPPRGQSTKLTAEIVSAARRRYADGEVLNHLAKEYDVSWHALHNAVTGASWKSVPMPGAA